MAWCRGGKSGKEVEMTHARDDDCPYAVPPTKLIEMNTNKDMEALRAYGGVEGVAQALLSDVNRGLDPLATGDASVQEHARVYGVNRYKEVPLKGFFKLLWEALKDTIIIVLMCGATVSTVLGLALEEQREKGEWIEGVAIWAAVLIVVSVGAGNDYQKDRQFRKINDQKDTIEIKVIRGGDTTLVKNSDIVVGDIVLLDTGDKIVADGIYVDGHGLVVDEASLTGESEPIKKNSEEDPWCRSGTQVSEGSARMLVVAVGQNSDWGKTMTLVGEAGDDTTPLQDKLTDVAATIGKLGAAVAVACFLALLIKWCVYHRGFPLAKINQNGPVQFFMYSVTIVVVAVPEGLPLAVTIALAYSMVKMMKDKNFVRHLAACETMGGATAICSDKTGTLTENRMTVTEGWFCGVKLDHAPTNKEVKPEVLQELQHNIALNSKAFIIDHGPQQMEFVGNRTDCALLVLMRKWGGDYKLVREAQQGNIVELYGFSSAKKMASVLVKQENRYRLYNKGAAEWVLRKCVSLYNEFGEVVPMTETAREELMEVVVGMASRGLRCICLTYTDFPLNDPRRPDDFFSSADNVDRDLICMAVVGIKDPVRAEVPEAVATCQRAGITVRMVTGDNIHTAKHIARECGILTDDGLALEGPAFRTMPTEELISLLPKLQVLARSSPEDKLTLVSLLKKEGEVVAVTGDGTNDAPALKESDVGLAMGIAGTEVSKEAADIVIMDDNFKSIVRAVLWGRSVFNSIRKFLQFQLNVNVVSLTLAFVGAIVGGRMPINILQLLWVNLIMDTMGALALATEDPDPALLLDKPHGRDEPIINRRMWKHITTQSMYQLFWMFLILYGGPVQFTRYEVISKCDFYIEGAEHANPNMCRDVAMRHLRVNETQAQYYCTLVQQCDMPCGDRQSPACPLTEVFKPQPVPKNKKEALCGRGVGDCADYKNMNSLLETLDDEYERQGEEDFKRVGSLLFNTFIFMQVFNEFNARRLKDEYNVFEGIHKSPIFMAVIAITLMFQIIIMQTPVGNFFKVKPINWLEWLISIAIGAGTVPTSLFVRFVSRCFQEDLNRSMSRVHTETRSKDVDHHVCYVRASSDNQLLPRSA